MEKKHRISSLPRLMECASSAVDSWEYDPASESASDGTAVHTALQMHVSGIEPDLRVICARYNADEDEVTRLFMYGCQAWETLKPYFTAVKSELKVASSLTVGHIDIAHHDGVTAAVLDWKTGRVRSNYREQVVGYAHALVSEYGMPESGVVSVMICWLRFGECETIHVNADDLKAFEERLTAQIRLVGKQYSPGQHCTYCPRQLECPARDAFMRSAATSLVEVKDPGEVSPATLAALYGRASVLRKALDRYDQAIRMAVASEGQLSIGDGMHLELVTREVEKLRAKEAWPVLIENGLTDEDLSQCVSITKGAVLDIYGSRAPRGKKGVMQCELMDKLRSADAVITRSEQRLEQRKDAPTAIEGGSHE